MWFVPYEEESERMIINIGLLEKVFNERMNFLRIKPTASMGMNYFVEDSIEIAPDVDSSGEEGDNG